MDGGQRGDARPARSVGLRVGALPRLAWSGALRNAVFVPPWIAVRVHSVNADDLGIALVPWPVELGDEIAVERHPWPLEVVDIVWAPPGAKVAALVKVRAAVLHTV